MYDFFSLYIFLIRPNSPNQSNEARTTSIKGFNLCRVFSAIYHATSQWVMKIDTNLSYLYSVKKSMDLKYNIMSITCRFHVSYLTLCVSVKHVEIFCQTKHGCSKITFLYYYISLNRKSKQRNQLRTILIL